MISVPNRPFSTDIITGLMLPDGIFVATLGKQLINAHFTNSGASTVADSSIYLESVSHPGIVVTPNTHHASNLASGASRVLSWEADLSGASAGVHYISFIVETASSIDRVIKKIFVTRIHFDAATTTFRAETPEGVMEVRFQDLVVPTNRICCRGRRRQKPDKREVSQFLNQFGMLFEGHDPEFEFCLPYYLPLNLEAGVIPTPPFSGQYGDLPFRDPWWKILLAIIALFLAIAAALAEREYGTGSIEVTTGCGITDGESPDAVCGVSASGGGTSYLAAGLIAAAAAAGTAAAASDVRDPFRRGQDKTVPSVGEVTLSENMKMSFIYPEPVALGKPFAAGLEWEYKRVTTGVTYTYSAKDMNNNVHVLSNYQISAPEVVHWYKEEPFLIRGEFFDKDGKQLKGNELFVQCFLVGPHGEYHKILMQDDGLYPDEKPSDGIYTGIYYFERENKPHGMWMYYVIAQDINNAQPDMDPEEAAQIIGGMVVTHQLVITFDKDRCPFIPDGHVNVI